MQDSPTFTSLFRIVSELVHGLMAFITDASSVFLGVSRATIPTCEVLGVDALCDILEERSITTGAMIGAVDSDVSKKAQDMACHLAEAGGVVLYWDMRGGLFCLNARSGSPAGKRLLFIGETDVERGLKIIESLTRGVLVHAVFIEGRYLSRDFSRPSIDGTQRGMGSSVYEMDCTQQTLAIQRFFKNKMPGKRPSLIWADTFDDMPRPHTLKRFYQAQACQWVTPL